MAYAIIGIKKLKTAGNIAGVIDHMTRSRPTPNSNGKENDIIVPPPKVEDLMQDLSLYHPRKNACLCYDVLFAVSPEWLEGKSEAQIKEWEQKTYEWACSKFKKDNIRGFIAHHDELSIHCQAIIVCEHEGRLCARHYTGGREKMRALWTEYALAMRPLGLERGREYSPAKHQEIKEYYAAVKKGARLAAVRKVKAEELPSPEIMDRINPKQYAADLVNRATYLIRKENGNLRAELERERRQREAIINRVTNDRILYHDLKDNPDRFRQLKKELDAERQARAEERKEFKELAAAIKSYFRRNIAENSTLRLPDRLGRLKDFQEIRDAVSLSLTADVKERGRGSMTLARGK